MKEEPTHLSAIGDEALEARIIAWVLGESSPFEAAELETLCERQPEWRVFQRRMMTLHGLLGEATKSAAAEDWKISDEKRDKLAELIGGRDAKTATPKRRPRVWLKRYAALAACLAVAAMIGVFSPVTLKQSRKSKEIVATHEAQPSPKAKYRNQSGEGYPEMKPTPLPVTPATPTVDDEDPFSAGEESESDSTVMREMQYPNEYEAAELPGSIAVGDQAAVIAAKSAIESAAVVHADPFTEDGRPSSALAGRGGFARDREVEERIANAVGVPTLEEIPARGELFKREPSRPSASSSQVMQESSLAEREILRRQAMGSGVLNSVTEGGLRKDLAGMASGGGGGGVADNTDWSDTDAKDPANVAVVEGVDAAAFESLSGTSGKGLSDATKRAEGEKNLGRFDEAKKSYESALRIDPENQEARKGLEEVTAAKSDYYRASYDHSRAEILMEVDKAWELQVLPPAQKKASAKQTDAIADAKAEIAAIESFVSKPNLKVLGEGKDKPTETLAAQEPYSTFSLRVSDNSFRIARAAMQQNQRPAAESVRVEEFYNAFDYGDPVPTAQEPVAAAMEQSAHPILPQRNLLRIGLRTAAAGRGSQQALRLTLLVDQSGSMARADRNGVLLTAVKELSAMLTARDQISVIGFSRTPRLLAEAITGDQQAKIIEVLSRPPTDGGTNLEEALKLGEMVAKRNQAQGAQNRILLLTDGAANLGDANPEHLSAWAKAVRQQGLSFDNTGIGTDGLNDPLLVEIARNGNGRYVVMNDVAQAKQFASQLAGAFRPAAENVKVQVRFNEQRVSRYQLVGFEKDMLKTEDFRNDKVDAAEMTAAEAGQALYQLEVLPEGTGDIGEVSVRFRDVATAQMVERKWTIRYEANAPAFDRATPSMKLAGLAMLTGQKLQGEGIATMIRFSELQEPIRHVRDAYPSVRRVGELLEMVQQLND
jgi:Mg-chelatase subunit ChlD